MRAAALKQSLPEIEIRVGLDEPAVRAIFFLWELVSLEKGKPYDENRLAAYLMARVERGTLLPVVAWDGDEPVGFCCMMMDTDPFTGETTAFGDHAFVRVEWRGEGVFGDIAQAAADVAGFCSCDALLAPCGNESAFLLRHYENMGFEKAGYLVRRKC